MKNHNRRKRKRRFINGTKGVISLFLCLIMTPLASLAFALVEFSRFQDTVAISEEVLDVSALSTLANYDEYLQKRFGLFAVSQDCDINETFVENVNENSSVMEGMSVSGNTSAKGDLPLSDINVIKRQILDFSESTVLTEIILEDLQLQTLMDELDKLLAIGGLLDTLTKVKNMTSSVKDLVEKGEALVSHIEGAISQVDVVKRDATNFVNSIADLYKKLSEDGFKFDETSDETKLESLKTLALDYYDLIKKVYDKADTLIKSVDTLKGAVKDIPTKFTEFKNAFTAAKAAVLAATESTKSLTGSADTGSAGQGDGEAADAASSSTALFEEIIEELDGIMTEAGEALKQSTIDAITSAANTFSSSLSEGLGLDVTKRWDLKNYFSIPLSTAAQEDLLALISELPDAWNDRSYNNIVRVLKEKFVPDVFTMDFLGIKNTIKGAIEKAKNDFQSKVEESISGILTNLVNALKGLFDLDVFFDGSLNAYLDADTISMMLSDTGGNGVEEKNPYVSLLNAINKLLDAVDDLIAGLSGNFFALIDGICSLCESVIETVEAIVELTAKTVEKIGELIEWASGGHWEKFGELLLMSGYMVHNLPNRTMANSSNVTLNDGTIAVDTILSGQTLTGFPYSDIKTPAKEISLGIKKEGESGINAASNYLKSEIGSGSDKMFRGAELEYILAGTPSELMNQTVVFMQIYFLRLLVDLVPVFTDPNVATMATAATIACWAVYLIVAFAEPLCDTVLLVNGSEDVYFIKRTCYLTGLGLPKFAEHLATVATKKANIKQAALNSFNSLTEGKLDKYKDPKAEFLGGILKMDYATHVLLILMFTTTTDDMLRRLANIAQLEASYYYDQQGADFDFDIRKAYTSISSETEITFSSFLNVFQTNNSSGLLKKNFSRVNMY